MGVAHLGINLFPGDYVLTAVHPYDGLLMYYNVTVLSTIFEVNSSSQPSNNLVKYFRNGTDYYVKILDDLGNPIENTDVSININGVIYNRTTNAWGVAYLTINLAPGEYILTAIHPVTGLMVSSNITVLPILTGTNLNKVNGDSTPFNVTLLNGTGQPYSGQTITFNIHGVFYNKTTDVNGVASLPINLSPGAYIVTAYIDYIDDTHYYYSTSNVIAIMKP
jgi:hypothetical protein